MNLAYLRTFLAVVRTGNLNRAAEHLNVTQSTVTARLDSLDETLGHKLLIRSRRGAQLTKAGFAFQRHAEVMVQTWEQGVRAVGLPSGYSGIFSLACHGDTWEAAGSRWLERVREERPDLALEAWPGDPGDIERWLAGGLVDVALTPAPMAGPGLASREVARDRLVQVSTVSRGVRRWDAAYIYVDLGPEFRRQHSLAWRSGETAHTTFGSSRWALDHLLEKGGSAYLPWRLTEALVDAGRLHPVSGAPEFERGLYLIWREESLRAYPWIEEALGWF